MGHRDRNRRLLRGIYQESCYVEIRCTLCYLRLPTVFFMHDESGVPWHICKACSCRYRVIGRVSHLGNKKTAVILLLGFHGYRELIYKFLQMKRLDMFYKRATVSQENLKKTRKSLVMWEGEREGVL